MGAPLLSAVARLLDPGGELFVQTDVEERAALYAAQITSTRRSSPPATLRDRLASPRTPTARGARASTAPSTDGLPVHRLRYRRRARE